ncbi:conserved membrane hypothetical protein [[Clostridium] ultunense Esp]|nr:conserved membrane hypothetical protein [[Clostridium] ultunense Esp]
MANRMILFVFSFIFSLAFVYFVSYLYFGIDPFVRNPYALSDHYMEVTVNPTLEINTKKNGGENAREILEKLYNTLKEKEVTLIYDDIDSVGLGLFDPRDYFGNNPLVEGTIFPANREALAILRHDSYSFKKNREEKENEYLINNADGQKLKITGIYDQTHPLHNEAHEYVYNFFGKQLQNITGFYFIDADSRQIVESVITSLQKILKPYDEYVVSVIDKGVAKENLIKLVVNSLGTVGIIMIIAFIILLFNLSLIYVMLLFNEKKNIHIHLLFGATGKRIFLKYAKEAVVIFLLSASLAILIYSLFLSSLMNQTLTLSFYLNIFFANVAFLSLLWILLFFIVRFIKEPGR